MRILTITSHISSNALPCFQRNKTGFGYMVHDIISTLSMKEEVDVLVYYYRFAELRLDGARYIGISWLKLFAYLFLCLSPNAFIKLYKSYPISKGALLRLVYCWLLTGYFRHIIRKGHYDIVHIHGCSINNELWVRLCKDMNQKYLVTLHGLNSFSESINISLEEHKYERSFLHETIMGKHEITVISSGIKRKVLEVEHIKQSNHIEVVCNAFHFDALKSNNIDVRTKYGIPSSAHIVLYVGNISHNKNQRQMVSAFNLLPEAIRDNTYVLFVGRHSIGEDDLRPVVESSPHKEHLICCGGIDKSLMSSFFMEASATVLLSISEGFGLSLVEGMHFGVPTMTFTDIDAYEDIYHPCAMIGVPTRSDEAVARGLVLLLSSSWDKEAIKKYSLKFSGETMCDNYLKVFNRIVNCE